MVRKKILSILLITLLLSSTGYTQKEIDDYVVIDNKGETYKIHKSKLKIYNQLKKLFAKSNITSKDCKEIRKGLCKLIDKEISDKQWEIIKKDIELQHKNWLFFKREKNAPKNQPKNTNIVPKSYLPIYIQPLCDIKKNNPLIKAYYFLRPYYDYIVVEFTVVFSDEDHPNPVIDIAYDFVRLLQWGRIEDIETFYLIIDYNGSPEQIYFCYGDTGTHSRDQKFNAYNPCHYADLISSKKFTWKGSRPNIYLNTWNHLFGEYDTNLNLSDRIWETFPASKGTRVNAEDEH